MPKRPGSVLFMRPGMAAFTSPPIPMALKRKTKKKLISDSQLHDDDTGSPQVQIAILSKEITLLTTHLQEHKKDQSARKGLLGMVAQRRKLLNYLRMNKPEEYQKVLEVQGLKR
jgi:small subunit ribosomal protein S15